VLAASNEGKQLNKGNAMTKKIALAVAILLAVAAAILTIGYVNSPVDPIIFMGDDLHHAGFFGGMLAAAIVGIVFVFVGIVLTVVFAGVSMVLLFVALVVATVLLAVSLPVLIPVLTMLAVPFLLLYGLFRLIRKGGQPAM
jgi:hypothetical protein